MSRRTHRAAVLDALRTSAIVGALVPPARVYSSRTTTIPIGSMPAIVVFAPATRRRKKGAGRAPLFESKHQIVIDCFATGDTDEELADNLDLVAEAVDEELLESADFVSRWEELESCDEEIILEGTADGRHGLCRITLEGRLVESFPPRASTDLEGVDASFDLDGDGTDADPDDVELTINGLDE